MELSGARDAAIATVAAIAVAAGLIALVPLPWTIAVPASVAVGTTAIAVDVRFFGRPFSLESEQGSFAYKALLGAAASSLIIVAFFAGRAWPQGTEGYPFVVTGPGVTVFLKSAPIAGAQKNELVVPGDTVYVACRVAIDGLDWYQLIGERGWLSSAEAAPAPFTGLGAPPVCPN